MTTAYLLFDFDDERLLEDARIHALMGALVSDQGGWRFLKKPIVCDDSPGEVYVPNGHDTLANAWKNARRAAPRYGGGLWMEMENRDALRLAWGYDPRQARRLMLSIDTAVLRRRDQAANARALMQAAETLYRELHPIYGYGLFNYDLHTPQPPDAGMRAVWDYNLFSPAMVAQIGRDRLRYLPTWRAAELDDGGLLIEMAANPIAEAPHYTQYYRHAAQTLGLPYFQGAS